MLDYRITHVTRYTYADPVALCQNVAHLKPRAAPHQRCERTAVAVVPGPAVMDDRVDFFGNPVTYFSVQEPHRALTITATHRVAVDPPGPPDPAGTEPWEAVRDRLRNAECGMWNEVQESAAISYSPDLLDASQYLFDSRYAVAGDEFRRYAAESFPSGRPILEGVLDLSRRIYTEFSYDPRATTVATPVREVLANRRGVCQDFAHFMIVGLRSLGLAARYVSGYLSTVPPPGCPRLVGADATHAWVGVWCGSAGWVDADPTNNQIPGDRHVLLAWGRDYDDVSPVKGIALGGGRHEVSVSVDVQPV